MGVSTAFEEPDFVRKNTLQRISAASLIEMISKYPIVTRKLMIVCPKRPSHDEEIAMSNTADLMKAAAIAGDWEIVADLRGNNASATKIQNAITSKVPDFFTYYGHSLNLYIPGQKNNNLEFAITAANANVFLNRNACVTACKTLLSVGTPAVSANCVAYMGYNDYFTGVYYTGGGIISEFAEAVNAVYIALLEGRTFKDAKQIGWNKWDDLWKLWVKNSVDPSFTAGVLANRNALDFVGEPRGVARPIGLYFKSH
jgi:hypothetical protein